MTHYTLYPRQEAKTLFAKELRQQQTPGEQGLWRKLRAKRFHGLKFRRQIPIGIYIVDFICFEKKLIVEVDGDSHFQPGAQERDAKREEYLRSLGFTIFRCGNRDAVEVPESVLDRLSAMLRLS